MKKFIAIFSLFLIISSTLFSQIKGVLMPLEFSKSYEKNYRDTNGIPGKNYFSNYSDYIINAFFDPKTGKLTGNEKIIYHNRSKDTLYNIVIRLYQNFFQKGNQRDFQVYPGDINDGVIIKKLNINYKIFDITTAQFYGTNMTIDLNEKVLPSDDITIEIEWEFTVAQYTPVRTGRYGSNNYLVAYWYPQIAVYDDVFGWDFNSYGGSQEFYNDHNNFDVKITVASPNIVWATGLLVNTYEVYNKKYADRIKAATYSDTVVNILKPEDYKSSQILKSTVQNTWNFKAEKCPDFAFAVSSDHNWDAVGISMPNRTQRVLISGVYADSSGLFHSLAFVTRKIISYYSFQKPQIFYPYNSMTVFEGGGAMEYPMMVNVDDEKDTTAFYYVIAHEVGHSYFPFYCGTNETRYAWMDEGFISFFPRLAVDEIFKCKNKIEIVNRYQRIAGSEYDLPIMTPSNIIRDFYIYRNIAYNKPAYAFWVLHDYLGDSLFFAGIKEYARTWEYKHPYPFDFFNCFEKTIKKDLDWFWKPYFYEFAYPDLSITNVKLEGGIYITIENNGGLPVPIEMKIYYSADRVQDVKESIDCWKDSKKFDIYIPTNETPIKIILGNENIADINKNNNQYFFN